MVGAAVCSRIPGLAKSQREQCRKAPHAMPAVGEGAALGLRECRYQFRHHRWNCSHVSNDQVFGHVVVVGKDSVTPAHSVFITPRNTSRLLRICVQLAPQKALLPYKVAGSRNKTAQLTSRVSAMEIQCLGKCKKEKFGYGNPSPGRARKVVELIICYVSVSRARVGTSSQYVTS